VALVHPATPEAPVTNYEWFAFVILPIGVAIFGSVFAWAARRFIP